MTLPAEFVALLVVFALVYTLTTILLVRQVGKLGWQSEARKALEDLTAAVERLTIAMDSVHFVVEDDGRLHAHTDRR
jgi:hypothetical protein